MTFYNLDFACAEELVPAWDGRYRHRLFTQVMRIRWSEND